MVFINRPIEILLIEDSPTDVLITREVLSYSKLNNRLHIAQNGEEALAFLRRDEPFMDAPRPDLIFLDLNLPALDGREVLEAIKSDQSFKQIPVIVLTTSKADEDVKRAYDLHANCYVTKPVDFEQFTELVFAIEHFWFSVVTLPKPPEG